jgi:RNA polymerase sigma-70 factor (ECF subfamily)
MKQDERLERLFKTYYQQMYRLARTMLYDVDESRDVVSDVFAQIIQQQTVLLPETEEHYLMTSVRNRCRNVLQKKLIREQFRQHYLVETEPSDPVIDTTELMHYAETHLSLQAQRIFRMRFIDEMTYQQIGDELGIRKVAVYKHVSQAVELLRQKFYPKSK